MGFAPVSGPSPDSGKWSGDSPQPVPKARKVGGGAREGDISPIDGDGRVGISGKNLISGGLYVRF